ncbi:MAG: hypothetical protein R6V76_04300 [Desulfobacterales bacterium]
MYKKYFIIICIIIPALIAGYSWGESDLDDGISTFTDDGISKDDELGKKDNNINFIVLDAMADAKMKAKKGDKAAKTKSGDITGDKNENSVVVGAGAQTGNIYNIQVMK